MSPESTLVLPPRPEPPEPGDCCGGGCERCVIDAYEERLLQWQAVVELLRARAAGPGPA